MSFNVTSAHQSSVYLIQITVKTEERKNITRIENNSALLLNVFNIDNNQKCFLSSKSAYYYDF